MSSNYEPNNLINHADAKDEVAKLKLRPAIRQLAINTWYYNDGQDPPEADFMMQAYHHANWHGVDFATIGGPAAAVRELIKEWRVLYHVPEAQ